MPNHTCTTRVVDTPSKFLETIKEFVKNPNRQVLLALLDEHNTPCHPDCGKISFKNGSHIKTKTRCPFFIDSRSINCQWTESPCGKLWHEYVRLSNKKRAEKIESEPDEVLTLIYLDLIERLAKMEAEIGINKTLHKKE